MPTNKLGNHASSQPCQRVLHARFMPFHAQEGMNQPLAAACDLRQAYTEGNCSDNTTYLPLSADTMNQVAQGKQWVSAAFVTPYPPGFAVLVPGQVLTLGVLNFFWHITIKEIHGYHFESGFKVFTDAYFESSMKGSIS
jgi:arginine decarboxylase